MPETRDGPDTAGMRALWEAAYDLIVDHPMWIDGTGRGLDYSPEREARIGDFLDQLVTLPVVQRLAVDPAGSPHSSFPHRPVHATPAAQQKLAGRRAPGPR